MGYSFWQDEPDPWSEEEEEIEEDEEELGQFSWPEEDDDG